MLRVFVFKLSAVGDLYIYIHLSVLISFLCLRMNNEFEIYTKLSYGQAI